MIVNLKRILLASLGLALLLPLAWCSWPIEEFRHDYRRRIVSGEKGERVEMYLRDTISPLSPCEFGFGNPFRVLLSVKWADSEPQPPRRVRVELQLRSEEVVTRLELPLSGEWTDGSGASWSSYSSEEEVTLPQEDVLMTVTSPEDDKPLSVRRWFSVRVETHVLPRFLHCFIHLGA